MFVHLDTRISISTFWRDDHFCDLRAYLDQREFYSRVCIEEFLNLDEAYDFLHDLDKKSFG